MQRIDYAVFPGVPDHLLMPTMTKILGHIFRSNPSFKEFREWMRDEGIWHKEEVPNVLKFLDVELKPKPALGSWASALLDAPTPEEQQSMLFQLILDNNTLLVKYVFEALDMEGGGRLHSTYELHRMLSSYVYPGESIGLPQFQAWIKWAVLSGRIKLIGIRWGLTDEGKAIVPRLRMIDVEEFLEDEAEEAQQPEEGPPAEAPKPAKAEPPVTKAKSPAPAKSTEAPAPKPAKDPVKTTADRSDSEDLPDMPDMPSTPPPVDEAAAQAYEAQLAAMIEEAPDAEDAVDDAPKSSAPAASRRILSPVKAHKQRLRSSEQPQAPMELPDVIAALRKYGRAQGLGGGSLFLACGLEARMYRNEAKRFLYLAGLLARLYGAAPDGRLTELVLERSGGLNPLAALLERPEAAPELIVRWGLAMPAAEYSAARGAIFDSLIGARALNTKADLPTVLAQSPRSEVLITELQRGLLKGAPSMAAFWLAREMVRLELWTHPAAKEVSSVPSRVNRLMAYRLRIIESHFATSTSTLIAVARHLTATLPPGSVEAVAFEALAPDDHLRFACNHIPVCQEPCDFQVSC